MLGLGMQCHHFNYRIRIIVIRHFTQTGHLIFLKRVQSEGFILFLLLFLPGRISASARTRFSLPTKIWITRWRNIAIFPRGGHPGSM